MSTRFFFKHTVNNHPLPYILSKNLNKHFKLVSDCVSLSFPRIDAVTADFWYRPPVELLTNGAP